MSFYQGPVVRLTHLGTNQWGVLSVYFLDTNCDENILTNFMHGQDARAVIIPADIIKDFDAENTTHIESVFDAHTCTESWRAL
jgi:hypothetical protein